MFLRGKLLCNLFRGQHEGSSEDGFLREDQHFIELENTAYNSQDYTYQQDRFGLIPAPAEETYAVSDATDDYAHPRTSSLLTDIPNNIVPSTSCHRIRTEDSLNSEEDFDPSEEECIPNTGEESTDCEFEERTQVVIPEISSSSIDDVENITREVRSTQVLNTTPIDAEPESPPLVLTKTMSRKRTLNKSGWKCNVRKKRAIAGKKYTSKKGKFVSEKKVKPACACRLKCNERIGENVRTSLFQKYYAEEMTWDLKRQFIISRVSEVATARCRRRDPVEPPKRLYTLNYTFVVNEQVEKVCKTFFLNTLAISETVVRNAVKKSTHGFVQPDRRGRHPPPNKTADIVKETVRKHIDKVPKYESHYSRNRTERLYLGSHLNIDKLYTLYVEFCAEENIPKENIAKAWLYRHIFNTEFNLGFNPPANDTCDDCDAFVIKYKNATDESEKNNIKAEHDKHLQESHLRYHLKRVDKIMATESHGTQKS